MRFLRTAPLITALIFATLPVFAQTIRVLVPIVATGANGMFGSRWTSEVVAFNTSAVPVVIGFSYTCLFECPSFGLGPSLGQELVIHTQSAVPAAFVFLPNEQADAIELGLRVRDVSQQSDSWGAEVPVVRADRAFARPFDLLNVPLPSRFRQTLRIYDFEKSGGSVRVQYYNMTGGPALKEYVLPLLTPTDIYTPAYLQFDQFAGLPELAGVDRIRVRISPMDASQRLWAMVSVTNNVTQELTLITPQ
jgi:hypothetical protein